ncbi:MAG: alanine dehydrogenase [Actinomycetia bacterium]|nr:alanine dehydrogenase [Actinomycetes bacterium]
MIVGVPKEIKNEERRVGMTPGSVRELTSRGHSVLVEGSAGLGSGYPDSAYADVGAKVVDGPDTVFAEAELIVKVKEPQAPERARLREGQTLFTYLHLAPDPDQARDLLASGATCIAYETVLGRDGGLPLLAPMSKVAGRMSIQAGAHCLEAPQGGSGILLGGVPGVAPAKVTVIGGGVVGTNAIEMAVGLGADVAILDRSVDVLDRLARRFGPALRTVYSTQAALDEWVLGADLVIGAVLVPGAAAPRLVTEEMVKGMKSGSVLVDVAIDQGGCFQTSHATTHAEPTYMVHDVVHYCVANMPGAVPHTSTEALNDVTLPYVIALADQGVVDALNSVPGFLGGLNTHKGMLTEEAAADALGLEFVAEADALSR